MTKSKDAGVGRPREFNLDVALEQALDVFWRNGYEGTSLVDLTTAMGIKKPSLYAAFGNKEALFVKAIDLYAKRPDSIDAKAERYTKVEDFIRALLVDSAMCYTDEQRPQGCALIKSTQSCSKASQPVKNAIVGHMARTHQVLVERLQLAQQQGEIRADYDVAVLGRLITTLFSGMAVQASEGATTQELLQVAELAADNILARCLSESA